MKVFVVYLVIFTKCFITMKVQEIESWNFACPNILKRCAWRPNFSHFGWEMTKISTVPVQHNCPTFSFAYCIMLLIGTAVPKPNFCVTLSSGQEFFETPSQVHAQMMRDFLQQKQVLATAFTSWSLGNTHVCHWEIGEVEGFRTN